jgi:hypothetical protein
MTEDEYQRWVEEMMITTMARRTCPDILDVPSEPITNAHDHAALEERLTGEDRRMLREMGISL